MGAATRNPRTCRILIHIPACGRRYSRNVNHDTRFGETSDARPDPHSNGVSATPILFSGKPNFAVRDRRGKNGRCRSNVLRQRPKLIVVRHFGELVGLTVWLLVRVRPAPPRIRAHRRFPLLWKCPSIAGLFELECFVSDKVSWSDTPAFHNTLVVGSSPTNSTTQSRATREFLIPCQKALNWRVFLK